MNLYIDDFNIEEIDIDVFSNEQFDLELSVNEAREQFNILKNKGRMLSDFDNDIWTVTKLDYQTHRRNLDFTLFNSSVFNSTLAVEFKLIVKCWIVGHISVHKTVWSTYFTYFSNAYRLTKGFQETEVKTLLDFLEYGDLTNKSKVDYIIALCNFFDFSDMEISEAYVPSLIELQRKIPTEQSIRALPPFPAILSFSYYLEQHFEKLLALSQEGETEKELFYLYPLVIWWRLTNIIPMRPTEFCLIERDCFVSETRKLKLPRRKQNGKRVQILDEILLDQDMYDLIEDYKEITEPFGSTKTLISYPSLIYVTPTRARKRDKKQFSIHSLVSQINYFYRVMEQEYNCYIPKEDRLRPNDTRHLAFVSLMMQGHTPLEIARLGGHSTISAQYHYSGHTEHWVDCEVFKLLTKAKQFKKHSTHSSFIPDEVKLKVYNPEGDCKTKLKVGYCKDKLQRCESKVCYFCSHWGITPEEFIEKQEEIKADISSRKNKINELIALVQNTNRLILNNEMPVKDASLFTDMKTATNKLQNEMKNLATLYSKIGEGMLIDEKNSRS